MSTNIAPSLRTPPIPRKPKPREESLPILANKKTLPSYIPGFTSWKHLQGAYGDFSDYSKRAYHWVHRNREQAIFQVTAPFAGISHDKPKILRERLEKLPGGPYSEHFFYESRGWEPNHSSAVRLEALRQYLSSLPFKSPHYLAYQPLKKHRELVSNLSQKYDFIYDLSQERKSLRATRRSLSQLKIDLRALVCDFKKDSPSICYPTLEGKTSFCLPIHIDHHFLTILVSLETEDTCRIHIFNKGKQPKYNPFLKEKAYIEVSSDHGVYDFSEIEVRGVQNTIALNPLFLRDLLVFNVDDPNITSFYDFLYDSLIIKGRGDVYFTKEERELSSRSLSTKEFKEQPGKFPHLHKRMQQSFCYDTNISTIEGLLVDRTARRKEKLYRCNLSIATLAKRTFLSKKLRMNYELLLQRAANLKKKLLTETSLPSKGTEKLI